MRKYAYAWITLTFFLVTFALHWVFGWQAFVNDAQEHGTQPEFNSFLIQASRDTFENWQSEFLQLLWQVVGLAYFLYVGSPSSKENDDRLEAKVDCLLRLTAADRGKKIVDRLDQIYLREAGHSKPHAHQEVDRVLDEG